MTESSERITCQELTELVSDYIEAALPAHETALFEQHLNFCDGCDWYVDQMRATIAAVGRVEAATVPPELRDRLLAAFRDRGRS
jgi:anti-sigma factor RsiW